MVLGLIGIFKPPRKEQYQFATGIRILSLIYSCYSINSFSLLKVNTRKHMLTILFLKKGWLNFYMK